MKRTVTTVSPAALTAFNAGVARARHAYANRKPLGRATNCDTGCGRRTESITGRCAECRKDNK